MKRLIGNITDEKLFNLYFCRTTNRAWWTSVGHDDDEFKELPAIVDFKDRLPFNINYKEINLKEKLTDYLKDSSFGAVSDLDGNAVLDTIDQYATIYQASDLTFYEHCKRQAEILSLYYGNDLQMSVDDLQSLCDTHIRGLALMPSGKLFTIKTGIFGTMPVSATGTNKFIHWLNYELDMHSYLECMFDRSKTACRQELIQLPTRSPYNSSLYDGNVRDESPVADSAGNLPLLTRSNSYILPSPENFISKTRNCDNRPAPNRLTLNTASLTVLNDGVLVGDSAKESCTAGSLAQLFLGGHHPDQKTFSHFSSSVNGQQAIFILTEIGQEKQQDLMLEYLKLPEVFPLTSSASLAMVRLLIDPATNDVDPTTIVVSNPFKYTWVTSPLNRFGHMDKTGSQEQVSYIPKPVGIHEHGDYIYFFFREMDWENTPVPSHSIRRYHHKLNSYSQSLYFPWEKDFTNHSYMKLEETPGNTYEELYAPDYTGWQHVNNNLKVTGRVARVAKADAGLPMGLQDANLFDLDHRLSLSAFQTFVKTRLTCRVPVAGMYHLHYAMCFD